MSFPSLSHVRRARTLALAYLFMAPLPVTAEITISNVSPAQDQIVDSVFTVSARVESTFQLAELVAEVEDRSTMLAPAGAPFEFEGQIDLGGLASGAKTLTLRATDVFDDSAEVTRNVTLDLVPEIEVLKPKYNSVARTSIEIEALCVDDDPAGCSEIRVYTGPCLGHLLYASPGGHLDVTVSLAFFDGRKVQLCIGGFDSTGRFRSVGRYVWVESSTLLTEVEALTGLVVDATEDRVLLEAGDASVVWVYDRESTATTTIWNEPGSRVSPAELTPTGVVFTKSTSPYNLYDYNNGVLVDLGAYTEMYAMSYPYMSWISGNPRDIYRRNLETGVTELIASDVYPWTDVAPDGRILFLTWDYQIRLFDGNAIETITDDLTYFYDRPHFNGDEIVYVKGVAPVCCSARPKTLAIRDGSTETLLYPMVSDSKFRRFLIRNGWLAFVKPEGAGQTDQVWLRSPSGAETQISFFGSDSTILSLGPDGEVVILNGADIYLATTGTFEATDLHWFAQTFPSWFSEFFFIGTKLHTRIGRSLFEVDADFHRIFADGFESGSISMWTTGAP